jgi:RNA polymerase sigma-70 factor (ECF subfamily)
MLGSLSEADDAVQESWLRLSRSDTTAVENLGGWLTTVVARVCLNMLRARRSRREEPLHLWAPQSVVSHEAMIDPEQEALLADAVGLALLVILDTLSPAERVAFVLHDLFDVPFDQIARVVGRTSTAARQLASRARRRVRQGRTMTRVSDADLAQQRAVVEAFLAASRAGDFATLLALLDPDVVLHADQRAVPPGASGEVHGAVAVAQSALAFSRRARWAELTRVNGAVGVVVAPRGRLSLVLTVAITNGKITAIDVIADPGRLYQLDLAILTG